MNAPAQLVESPTPGRLPLIVFTVLAVLNGLAYWLLSAAIHPDESFASYVIYRHGDLQFLPTIFAISRGNFGESCVQEFAGQGVVSLQLVGFSFYAMFVWAFGKAGFILADVAVSLGYAFLLFKFFRTVGASRVGSYISASLILSGALGWLAVDVLQQKLGSPIYLRFHGQRWQRPHLTELFMVLAITGALSLLLNKEAVRSRRAWLALGIGLPLLASGDPFSALAIGLFFVWVLVWLVVNGQFGWPLVGGVCLTAVMCAIGIFPGVLQRLSEHPDLPIRYGVFPVNRLEPIYLGLTMKSMQVVWALCIASIAGWLWWRCPPKHRDSRWGIVAVGLIGLVLCAWVALPLSCVIFGKSIQPYHFYDTGKKINSYAIVASLMLIIRWWRMRRRGSAGSDANSLAVSTFSPRGAWLLIVPLCAVGIFSREWKAVGQTGHMRSANFSGAWSEKAPLATGKKAPTYRHDFNVLMSVLAQPEFADCKTLATFDHQANAWWLSLAGAAHYVYNPDTAITTLPDAKIETRLLRLARELGMSEAFFAGFIQQEFVTKFWLSFDKYQFSQAYQWSSLDDYLPHQLDHLRQQDKFDNFSVCIPQSEMRRLAAAYKITEAPTFADSPDLIILLNTPIEKWLRPTHKKYGSPTFQNHHFRVWRKRKIASSSP